MASIRFYPTEYIRTEEAFCLFLSLRYMIKYNHHLGQFVERKWEAVWCVF
jgi:hypothetical protein